MTARTVEYEQSDDYLIIRQQQHPEYKRIRRTWNARNHSVENGRHRRSSAILVVNETAPNIVSEMTVV